MNIYPLVLGLIIATSSCTNSKSDNKDKDPGTVGEQSENQTSKPPTSGQGARDLAVSLRGKPHFMIGLDNQGGGAFEEQGIKIDLFYAYLCCGYGASGWIGWNKGGTYVDVICKKADSNKATPIFTYYQLALELENNNYNIFTHENLHQYLKDVKLMYQRLAVFDKPAVVHLEPDFFGYLQQHSRNNKTSPDKIRAKLHYDDFHDCDQLPETVRGLMECLVHMGRTIAPKTKVGYAASMWGDWYDPSDPKADIEASGASVGRFLNAMGAANTDLIVVETSDRDAGYWESQGRQNVYWDVNNKTLPNFHGHLRWVKSLTQTLKLPALWWQTPLGVPSDNSGSNEHWRDNRVFYFFRHIDELIAAGGVGMAFGTGAKGQTTITSDGFQFRDAAKKYNENPVEIP